MNIEFSGDEARFLTEFAAKQYEGAKDNLETCTPIHVVERETECFVQGDGNAWLCEADDDCAIYKDFGSMIDELRDGGLELPDYQEVEYDDVNGVWISGEAEYCKAYGISARPGTIIKNYRPVAFFFIRDEAVRYRDGYQSHNCGKCRIYTYGLGYANEGDLPVFRNLLMRMGSMLISEAALEAKEEV